MKSTGCTTLCLPSVFFPYFGPRTARFVQSLARPTYARVTPGYYANADHPELLFVEAIVLVSTYGSYPQP
jgi:hypothetical protein